VYQQWKELLNARNHLCWGKNSSIHHHKQWIAQTWALKLMHWHQDITSWELLSYLIHFVVMFMIIVFQSCNIWHTLRKLKHPTYLLVNSRVWELPHTLYTASAQDTKIWNLTPIKSLQLCVWMKCWWHLALITTDSFSSLKERFITIDFHVTTSTDIYYHHITLHSCKCNKCDL
jgi:hypothetical protein